MNLINTLKTNKPKLAKRLKQLGIWGFLFFLLKGIAWLVIGYLVVRK